jgi:NAD(P)H dehydrogenase (quinone)
VLLHLAALAVIAVPASLSGYRTRGAPQISDLYASNFDPRESGRHFTVRRDPERFDAAAEQRFSWEHQALPADIADEVHKVLSADLVILQFPLWWFGPPAILKGWLDRVFVYGGMYSSARRHDRGVCRGKRALLCVTAGSSEAACSPDGPEGDTRLMLWPTLYALRYVGFTVLEPFLIHGVRSGLGRSREAEVDSSGAQSVHPAHHEWKMIRASTHGFGRSFFDPHAV